MRELSGCQGAQCRENVGRGVRIRRALAALAVPTVAVVLVLAACATNPVTGETELMLLSETEERRLGERTHEQIVQTYGVYRGQDLTEYIRGIGQPIADISHRPDLEWEFQVIDSPVINAFAVPGGFVYMTRGIMAYLNSEAELAGVLGHEIGHVTARHTAQRYSQARLAQLGLGLGAALSDTFARFAGLAQVGVQLLFLEFSRDNERQSDRLGVEYAARTGYDPAEVAGFFETLDRMQAESDEGSLPTWLSTHPDPGERVQTIRKLSEEWKDRVGPREWNVARERYLNRIDGIVYGEDPRQGYVDEDVFYHPELCLRFPLPHGWKVLNTASQVQIVAPDEEGAILFTLGDQDTPRAAADAFVAANGPEVLDRRVMTIREMDAVRLISRLQTRSWPLRIVSTFIRWAEKVLVFHGFSMESTFSYYRRDFERTVGGLQELMDSDRLNVEPDRIRIVRIRSRRTLEEVLRSHGVAEEHREAMSLINAMRMDQVLDAGAAIKIVERGR